MSYIDWKAGDKIVCVDDQPSKESGELHSRLSREHIYTIRWIGPAAWGGRNLFPGCSIGVRLVEVVREKDLAYAAARFRPVQRRATSISIFTQMLNPSKVDA